MGREVIVQGQGSELCKSTMIPPMTVVPDLKCLTAQNCSIPPLWSLWDREIWRMWEVVIQHQKILNHQVVHIGGVLPSADILPEVLLC